MSLAFPKEGSQKSQSELIGAFAQLILLIGFGCSRFMYHIYTYIIYIYVYDIHLAPKETVDVKIEGFLGGSQPKVSFHLPGLLWSNHLPLDLPQVILAL